MNFSAHHYVPVVKVKRGEKKALEAISDPLRSRITPLLEIVERKSEKTLDDHLNTAFHNLASAVNLYSRCLLDLREIESDGPSAAATTFRRAATEGLVFTPVTGISRTVDVAAALRYKSNGIAVRLTREEFEGGLLQRDLRAFLTRHGLAHAEVDLIVDLGPVDEFIQEGVSKLATNFLMEVPEHTRWRTLTISACAFPASMGGLERNSHGLVERNEWKVWRDELYANRQRLARLPTFSDCVIQHPAGVEGFDFRTMQASAAVRYALPDDWLLIKGVGTRGVPAKQQFPDLAGRLVYGNLRKHFNGANHCVGCENMKNAADGSSGLGSPEVWRRLGSIHHITLVMEHLNSLTWP